MKGANELAGQISITLLAGALALGVLAGQSQCTAVDADGDGWTTEDGDCDDSDANVHPGATEVCDEVDNDCDESIDEGYNDDCTLAGPFTGPVADAPGGQRVMDADGNLYYASYSGGMYRVPAGGGTSELLFTQQDIGAYGFATSTYVLDNGLVTFFSGLNGIMAYDPETGELSTYADTPDSNGYAFSHFVDKEGNMGVGVVDYVVHSDGSGETVSYLSWYSLIDDDYLYTLESSSVYIQKHDGSERASYGTGLDDAYGMAMGADGAIYIGQGNTNPSTIFKIPAGGGEAVSFATLPIAVTAVIADSDGSIYASGYSGDSLYLIDPETGDTSVYGCDPDGCD